MTKLEKLRHASVLILGFFLFAVAHHEHLSPALVTRGCVPSCRLRT